HSHAGLCAAETLLSRSRSLQRKRSRGEGCRVRAGLSPEAPAQGAAAGEDGLERHRRVFAWQGRRRSERWHGDVEARALHGWRHWGRSARCARREKAEASVSYYQPRVAARTASMGATAIEQRGITSREDTESFMREQGYAWAPGRGWVDMVPGRKPN